MTWSIMRILSLSALVLVLATACMATSGEAGPTRSTVDEAQEGAVPESPCNDEPLRWTVSLVMESLPEVGGAREQLRSRCGAGIQHCSCDAMREYLMTSGAVEEWRSQCCLESRRCGEEGLCTSGSLGGQALVDRLVESAEVSLALMQPRLQCLDEACGVTTRGCAMSEGCVASGRCDITDTGQCGPTREEHCVSSVACQERNACSLSETDGECVCDLDDPCMCSTECRQYGSCSTNDEMMACSPASDEHCQQSIGCIEHGDCDFGEFYDGIFGLTRPVCYSRAKATVEMAMTGVRRALEPASNYPLRQALELADGDAQIRANVRRAQDPATLDLEHSWVEVTIEPAQAEGERLSYSVDCEGFFSTLRATLDAQALRQGSYEVLVDVGRVRTAQNTLYDHRQDLCESFDGMSREPISWVGPVWSVEHSRWWSDPMGRGYGRYQLEAFDVRTGDKAPLDLLIEPDTIVAALHDDPWIRDRIDRLRENQVEGAEAAIAAFEDARTLAAVEEALAVVLHLDDQWGLWDVDNLFGGYSFFDYDEARNRASLRLEIRHRRTRPPDPAVTLGLWVRPRDEFRQDFRRAQHEGWTMSGDTSVPEPNYRLSSE